MAEQHYRAFGIRTTDYVGCKRHSGTASQLIDACLLTEDDLDAVRVKVRAWCGARRIERRGDRCAVTMYCTAQQLRDLGEVALSERLAREDRAFQTFLNRLATR
jgi:hypothetical protein